MESLFTEPYKIESNGLFAKDSTVSDINDVGNQNDTDLSFQLGIPPKFSLPPNNGGLFLRRGMLNAIGKMASAAPFYMGIGYMYTYDDDIAEKIGGYPKGAILRYTDTNGRSHLVESLLENNKVDFRIYGPDGSSWAVITGGSRSFFVNWNSLTTKNVEITTAGNTNTTVYTPVAKEIVVEKDSVVFCGNLHYDVVRTVTGASFDLAICIRSVIDGVSTWVPLATAVWDNSGNTSIGRINTLGSVYMKAGTSIALCGWGTFGAITAIEASDSNYPFDGAFLCFELAEV